MFGYIYKSIQYLLEPLGLKYYNLYNDQFNNEKFEGVDYPAVLIDIKFSESLRYHKKIQMFEVDVDLYLATRFTSDLRKGDIQQDAGLVHLDMLTELFKTLENKSTTDLPTELLSDRLNMGHIHRTNVEMLTNYNSIKVTKNTFAFMFTDASAYPTYTEVDVDYELVTFINDVAQAKTIQIN